MYKRVFLTTLMTFAVTVAASVGGANSFDGKWVLDKKASNTATITPPDDLRQNIKAGGGNIAIDSTFKEPNNAITPLLYLGIMVTNLKEKVQSVPGLDVNAFAACFDAKATLDAVKADEEEATALGVRSTPTFFINGRKLEGAVPYETFKAALDQALGGGQTGPGAAGAVNPTPEVVKPG